MRKSDVGVPPCGDGAPIRFFGGGNTEIFALWGEKMRGVWADLKKIHIFDRSGTALVVSVTCNLLKTECNHEKVQMYRLRLDL